MARVLELRQENGLEATEEAVYADLLKSKCKWVLSETPRYRLAGRSPIWVSGKYLSSYGYCPATGEKDGKEQKQPRQAASAPAAPANLSKVDESVFYKVLHAKGFTVKVTQDLLTGEIQTQLPEVVRKLELTFSGIPSNAAGIHVTQTSPQIQLAMSLDKFLEISGIRP